MRLAGNFARVFGVRGSAVLLGRLLGHVAGLCLPARRPFGRQVLARRQERPAVRRGSTARQAPDTAQRVAIPLLEWLDRAGVTRRLADDRRTIREPPGSPKPNGER